MPVKDKFMEWFANNPTEAVSALAARGWVTAEQANKMTEAEFEQARRQIAAERAYQQQERLGQAIVAFDKTLEDRTFQMAGMIAAGQSELDKTEVATRARDVAEAVMAMFGKVRPTE